MSCSASGRQTRERPPFGCQHKNKSHREESGSCSTYLELSTGKGWLDLEAALASGQDRHVDSNIHPRCRQQLFSPAISRMTDEVLATCASVLPNIKALPAPWDH